MSLLLNCLRNLGIAIQSVKFVSQIHDWPNLCQQTRRVLEKPSKVIYHDDDFQGLLCYSYLCSLGEKRVKTVKKSFFIPYDLRKSVKSEFYDGFDTLFTTLTPGKVFSILMEKF